MRKAMRKRLVFLVVSWSIVPAGIAALVIMVGSGDEHNLYILATLLYFVAMSLMAYVVREEERS